MFQMLDRIDSALRARIEEVVFTAQQCGESGILDWAVRAANDAVALGRIRDKDLKTLARLEDTFAHDFYTPNTGDSISPLYA